MSTITEKVIKPGKVCGFCSTGGRHDLCPGGVLNGDEKTVITCTCPEHPLIPRCLNCGARGEGVSEVTWTCVDADGCAATSQKRRDETLRSLYGNFTDGDGTPRGPKPPKAPRAPKKAATGTCLCCGETTGGGLFRPGHDSKYLTRAVESIKGGKYTLAEVQELMTTQGISDALKAKLAKRVA